MPPTVAYMVQHLRDLARLRRVRDRIDREYAQPLDVVDEYLKEERAK